MATISNLHELIDKYYNNTIDESLISTDVETIPYGYTLDSGTFTYGYFIDPDVVQFVDIIKSFPSQIDVNGLIVMFLQKISENLAGGHPFDQIILVTDNFIDFLNFFGIPVENEGLENSLIAVCNGEEGIVQQALSEFHVDPDPIKKVDNLIPKLYHALDEQSKLMPIIPYSDPSYDGGEFYYLTDTAVRPDDYERIGGIAQALSGFSQLPPISQTLPVTTGFQYPPPGEKIGGPEVPSKPFFAPAAYSPQPTLPVATGGPSYSPPTPQRSAATWNPQALMKMGGPPTPQRFAPERSDVMDMVEPRKFLKAKMPTYQSQMPTNLLVIRDQEFNRSKRKSNDDYEIRRNIDFAGEDENAPPQLKRGAYSAEFSNPFFGRSNSDPTNRRSVPMNLGFGGKRRTRKYKRKQTKITKRRKQKKTGKPQKKSRKTIKKRIKINRKRKTRKHSF